MTWQEIADTGVRVLTVIGTPGIILWFLYDRHKIKTANRIANVNADEVEATLPDRMRSSSVVSLEAEIVALRNSFNTDRRIKDETIKWLTEQLGDARRDLAERDAVIDSLQDQLTMLKEKMRVMTLDLNRVQSRLDSVRTNQHPDGRNR